MGLLPSTDLLIVTLSLNILQETRANLEMEAG